jgi:cullin-associated NEDD8-dissociated protein 1
MVSTGLTHLQQGKVMVRKRANAFVGALAAVVPDAMLDAMMEELLKEIQGAEGRGPREVQNLIQTVGTVARTVGHRVGKHLCLVVPLLLRFLGGSGEKVEEEEEEEEQDDEKNELRETIFAALESVVLRCPREVTVHLPLIIAAALKFMKWDPNYTYAEEEEAGEGEGEGGAEEGGEEEEEEEEEDYAGSDDDDTSWKVRRAALKVLGVIIMSRPELLESLYAQCADELIGRFKEREENVRLDVIGCFSCLLKATLALEGQDRKRKAQVTWGLARQESEGGVSEDAMLVVEEGDEGGGGQALLASRVGPLVRVADKLLRKTEPSSASLSTSSSSSMAKTKSAVLSLLQTLVRVLHGGLEGHLRLMVEDVTRALDERAQGLKLDALALLQAIVEDHPAPALHPYLPDMIPAVTACAQEEWYKVVSQALRVLGLLIAILRPFPSPEERAAAQEDAAGTHAAAYVPALYAAIFPRLEASDIDQEIKEGAILAVGKLVAHAGDRLPKDELAGVLALLMEKLKNEITRTPTLRALAGVAASPLGIDLSPILAEAVEELAMFLRQQSRPLKLATLETLIGLVRSNAPAMVPALFELILRETAPLISDADLHLSHLALLLSLEVLEASPQATGPVVQQHVSPNVLRLAASPLLQGYALRSLLSLIDAMVEAQIPGMGPPTLTSAFEEIALHYPATASLSLSSSSPSQPPATASRGNAAPKQVINNLAVCMARVAAHPRTSPVEVAAFSDRLVLNLRSPEDPVRHLALSAMGELGAQQDLSTAVPKLQSIILESFEAGGNEEIKTAAAYALGRVTAGNLDVYLPLILQRLARDGAGPGGKKGEGGSAEATDSQGSPGSKPQQYLLLLSLKEVILTYTLYGKDFSPHVSVVLPCLLEHSWCREEGVRNMVAECLGALANIDPTNVFATLEACVREERKGGSEEEGKEQDKYLQGTVASALKFSLSSSPSTAALGVEVGGGQAAVYLAREEAGKTLLKETVSRALNIHVDEKTGTAEDLEVIRATLLLVNAAAHHQPKVLLPFFQTHAVPLLFKSLDLRLLRKVNLGPFTHTVDDGLPLRKTGLATVATLLDTLPSVLDLPAFMPHLAKGLEDKPDVQLLAHQILIKAARTSPSSLLASFDALLPPLESLAGKQLSETTVGSEADRALDSIRSAMRALIALSTVGRENKKEKNRGGKGNGLDYRLHTI